MPFPMLNYIQCFLSIAHYRCNLQNFCILARNIQRECLPGVLETSGIAKLERTESWGCCMFQRSVLCISEFPCVPKLLSLYITRFLSPLINPWTHMLAQALFHILTCPRLDIEVNLDMPNSIKSLTE